MAPGVQGENNKSRCPCHLSTSFTVHSLKTMQCLGTRATRTQERQCLGTRATRTQERQCLQRTCDTSSAHLRCTPSWQTVPLVLLCQRQPRPQSPWTPLRPHCWCAPACAPCPHPCPSLLCRSGGTRGAPCGGGTPHHSVITSLLWPSLLLPLLLPVLALAEKPLPSPLPPSSTLRPTAPGFLGAVSMGREEGGHRCCAERTDRHWAQRLPRTHAGRPAPPLLLRPRHSTGGVAGSRQWGGRPAPPLLLPA